MLFLGGVEIEQTLSLVFQVINLLPLPHGVKAEDLDFLDLCIYGVYCIPSGWMVETVNTAMRSF